MLNINDNSDLDNIQNSGASILPKFADAVYSELWGIGSIGINEFIRQVAMALEDFFNARIHIDDRRNIICDFPFSGVFEISIAKL